MKRRRRFVKRRMRFGFKLRKGKSYRRRYHISRGGIRF